MIQDVNTTDIGFMGGIDFPEFSDYFMYLYNHIQDKPLTQNTRYTFLLETSIELGSPTFSDSLAKTIHYFNTKEENSTLNWSMIVSL